MGENEENIGSCSKTKTLAVYNYQKCCTRIIVEAFEAYQCTEAMYGDKRLG